MWRGARETHVRVTRRRSAEARFERRTRRSSDSSVSESSQRRTGRPAALQRITLRVARQRRPVLARSQVVLDVIPVVEKDEVVEPAVVTGGAAGVLEVSLKPTEPEPREVPGQVNRREELPVNRRQRRPERDNQGSFDSPGPASIQARRAVRRDAGGGARATRCVECPGAASGRTSIPG